MGKRLVLVFLLVSLMCLSVVAIQPARAVSNTILVPDDYPTITAAIGNATDGDVIYVRNGFYNETVLEINKTLTLRGEDVRNTIVYLNPPQVYNYNLPIVVLERSPAIKVKANYVKLSGFTITSPGGISTTGDGIEITSNIITIVSSYSLSGSQLAVTRNSLTGGGLYLRGSNQTFAENTVEVDDVRSEGHSCTIRGNTISGSLAIEGSCNAITLNSYRSMNLRYGDSNTISGNAFGFLQMANNNYFFSNNIISGNIIKGPSSCGIFIGPGGRDNIFYDNYIVDQGYSPWNNIEFCGAVIFSDNSGVAVNNTFYHNVFINNTMNVRFDSDLVVGGNFWDNGIEGNFWSDYNGIDADNDGVGDTPYIINAENNDTYPLMSPIDVPIVTVPLPEYDSPLHLPEPSPSPTPTPTPTPSATPTPSPLQSSSPSHSPTPPPSKSPSPSPSTSPQPTQSHAPQTALVSTELIVAVAAVTAAVVAVSVLVVKQRFRRRS